MNKAKPQPIVDPRQLQLVAAFKLLDDRGRDTILKMAKAMPHKVPA